MSNMGQQEFTMQHMLEEVPYETKDFYECSIDGILLFDKTQFSLLKLGIELLVTTQ